MTDSHDARPERGNNSAQSGTRSDRRRFLQLLAATVTQTSAYMTHAAEGEEQSSQWHIDIAEQARVLKTDNALRLLVPNGSQANVIPVSERFTELSGVDCELVIVEVDDINTELILMSSTQETRIDVALPATFGLADLTERGVLQNLDVFARRYEPSGFREGYFFIQGDFLNESLYGYQTDGDAYLMFYNRSMLENAEHKQRYMDEFGETLTPAGTWAQLDQQMRFFHAPEQNRFGGSLFRNPTYSVWEWWLRFHATGQFPVDDDMTPLIASDEGINALTSMMDASASLSDTALSNSLFENWQEFARGDSYCNLGWGGTQKYLQSQSDSAEKWLVAPLPGGDVNGVQHRFGYMNWGWNYSVTAFSSQSELAYLFCLFATTPVMSTLAVQQEAGFFDPFRESHHEDPSIRKTYSKAFLDAQKSALQSSIPDFYLPGQGEYFNALRTSILDTQNGLLTPEEALGAAAERWKHTTRRYGRENQIRRWAELKRSYPKSFFP